MAATAANEDAQVLVRFVTKLPKELRVPETPVAVPATLKRYGLSQIINHLLALDPQRPFDFLISGELVRKTLDKHLLEHQLSAESTIEIEYVPAVVPPQHKLSAPHDDWVSCVEGSVQGQYLSGSYDGLIRTWTENLECSTSFAAHPSGVNCLRRLPASQGNMLLSCGKDRTIKLWQVDQGEGGAPSYSLVATYSGHMDSVEAVAPSPSGSRFCSAGWDGQLLVWETGRRVAKAAAEADAAAADEAGGKAASKKRKVANGSDAGHQAVPSGGLTISEASGSLQGHMHCVSSVAWPEEDTVYSGGWDHSVRRWSVEAGRCTDTYNGSKAVTSVASTSACPDLVAFGASDRAVRLWDTRTPNGDALNVKTMASHSNWVTCVAWCPSSAFHIASASHDATIKVWDIRTAVPLATLAEPTDKVLCVGWAAGGSGALLSGGADCQLRMYTIEQGL